ncbi:MAG TPA: WD40 repeat domain-containing protein [Xanthobacteraceae bacterium]|nr:WD40 repeat domain-containing protein [Xanthobacteraceae bacterium]
MTGVSSNTSSVIERTRPVEAGAAVVDTHFLGKNAVVVLGEEALLFVPQAGESRRVAVHAGAILSSASDRKRVITGGDDGKVVATDESGKSEVIAIDEKRRWIDRVAAGPAGAVAWSAGKSAYVRVLDRTHVLELPSSAGGLAFAPKGLRLATAHYNGVTLWFPNAQAAPERLTWKGSHHLVSFSPDGKYLMTTMQEPTLHGWRLADNKDMRMSGYSSRVRSLSWSASGKWLATGGAEQIILWPFTGKDGPMGKAPKQLAAFGVGVEIVACHPKQEVVAAGYADGLVLLVRIEDGAEILAKNPDKVPITALAWDESGSLLAWGSENGKAGIIPL